MGGERERGKEGNERQISGKGERCQDDYYATNERQSKYINKHNTYARDKQIFCLI